MKQIEMFEADDGRVYKTIEEAINRDLQIQFEEWYKTNYLCTKYGADVDFEDFWEWLCAHSVEVKQALETIY